jgi:23S rRNA-/tRNA-specific pseudouridylate synthase
MEIKGSKEISDAFDILFSQDINASDNDKSKILYENDDIIIISKH